MLAINSFRELHRHTSYCLVSPECAGILSSGLSLCERRDGKLMATGVDLYSNTY
jgi:hypothetical protein